MKIVETKFTERKIKVNVDKMRKRFIDNCTNCQLSPLLKDSKRKEICQKCIQRQFEINYKDILGGFGE